MEGSKHGIDVGGMVLWWSDEKITQHPVLWQEFP